MPADEIESCFSETKTVTSLVVAQMTSLKTLAAQRSPNNFLTGRVISSFISVDVLKAETMVRTTLETKLCNVFRASARARYAAKEYICG